MRVTNVWKPALDSRPSSRCARMRCANFKPSSSMPLGDRGEIWSALGTNPVHSGACRVESLMLRPFHRLGFAFPLPDVPSLAVTYFYEQLGGLTRPLLARPGQGRFPCWAAPRGGSPRTARPPPRRAVCSACAHGTSSIYSIDCFLLNYNSFTINGPTPPLRCRSS